MIKKTITYEDFNGKKVTEDFFFNLTKTELVELEVSEKEGLSEALKAIVDAQDNNQIVEKFKKIILLSYGQKSDDGRRFIKNDQLREEFSQTEAFSELFIELATDADAAAKFISGVVPASMASELQTVKSPLLNEAPVYEERKPARDMTREELIAALAEKNQ